jgi:hypothetical protein
VARTDWVETNDEQYTVEVEVGGVTVMTVVVPRGWRPSTDEDYASSSDEAESMAIAEFGNRLRKLIGDS